MKEEGFLFDHTTASPTEGTVGKGVGNRLLYGHAPPAPEEGTVGEGGKGFSMTTLLKFLKKAQWWMEGKGFICGSTAAAAAPAEGIHWWG